jgi:hypothetical protein
MEVGRSEVAEPLGSPAESPPRAAAVGFSVAPSDRTTVRWIAYSWHRSAPPLALGRGHLPQFLFEVDPLAAHQSVLRAR